VRAGAGAGVRVGVGVKPGIGGWGRGRELCQSGLGSGLPRPRNLRALVGRCGALDAGDGTLCACADGGDGSSVGLGVGRIEAGRGRRVRLGRFGVAV
jgi:hypothetical protein